MRYELQKIAHGIGALKYFAHETAKSKGFHDEPVPLATSLINIHGEVNEAWESFRKNIHDAPSEKLPMYTNLEEELADIIIRVADLAGARKLNLASAVVAKMKYNEGREHMHGKTC